MLLLGEGVEPEAHAQVGHVGLVDVVALRPRPPVQAVDPVHLHLQCAHTMSFGGTAKVLAKCLLKYYRISECHKASILCTLDVWLHDEHMSRLACIVHEPSGLGMLGVQLHDHHPDRPCIKSIFTCSAHAASKLHVLDVQLRNGHLIKPLSWCVSACFAHKASKMHMLDGRLHS